MADISISHDMLMRLALRACQSVPSDGIVFFGLRGVLPFDIGGTPFAAAHSMRLAAFDHQHMRCTLGQWRPANRDVAVFPGSTVPYIDAVRTARAKHGSGANMLMLGRYAYDRGLHRSGKPSAHRAFRQGTFFPVWRTADDLDYDLEDRLDTSGVTPAAYPWDNLHCAFHDDLDAPKFSSNGCQVVAGRPSTPANGHRPETGPWKRFVANAYGTDAGGQDRFTYFLFSGGELGLVSARPNGPFNRSLRFGSDGEWVIRVQEALMSRGYPFLTADGDFGRDTLEAVMSFQTREFGRGQADGVVGLNTAGALGIEWPALDGGPSKGVTVVRPAASRSPTPASVATSAVPLAWKASAVRVTPGFEVAGDPYLGVSGDFDRMGISCGALQWNIGSASLQPLVLAVPELRVIALMPNLGRDLLRACKGSVPAGLAIVRGWQAGAKLSPVGRTELKALMGSPEMRVQQDLKITVVADRALKQAGRWAVASGREAASRQEFLWFFDLVTQNGGLEGLTPEAVAAFIARNSEIGAQTVICDYLAGLTGGSGHVRDAHRNAALWHAQPPNLALELLVLSYLRSGSANPKWRHVVLNRKGAIAIGEGWVNGSLHDLSAEIG